MTAIPFASATLSETLRPLRGKRRGDPINADDWNAVVGACLTILEMVQNEGESARARLEANFARREHDHLGEVAPSWLDPELQQRLGTSVDAEGRGLVSSLEKKVDSLTAEVKALQNANAALESRLDRIAASDVDRNLTIRNLGKRVEAFGDFDKRLEKRNTDVTKLSPKLDDIFKLRENLTDEQGNPIKLIDLRGQVRNLERLGDQLTGIDGKPIKITDIQQQIRDLRDVAGLGQGLEPRFAEIAATVEKNVSEKVDSTVKTLKDTLVADQETKVANSVASKVTEAMVVQNAAINTRLNSIEQNVAQTVSTAVLGTVKADLETRGKAIDDKLAGVGALVTNAFGSARPEIEKSVRDTVTPAVLQEVKTTVGTAETRLDAKVKTIDTTVTTLKAGLPNDINTAVTALTNNVRTELLGTVDTKVKEARESILTTIPTAAKDAANAAIGNLDTRISTAVNTSVGNLDARVKTAVDQATVGLPALVESATKTEVAKLDVPKLVTTATTQAEQRINSNVALLINAEQTARTKAINETVNSLRGEIVATAKTEVEVLRKESDVKFKNVETRLPRNIILNPNL
jgi:hypothetical protein